MAEHQVMLEEYSNWFSGGGGETANDSEEELHVYQPWTVILFIADGGDDAGETGQRGIQRK